METAEEKTRIEINNLKQELKMQKSYYETKIDAMQKDYDKLKQSRQNENNIEWMQVHPASTQNRKLGQVPKYVPMNMLNEKMAQHNHSQSLKRLNERGGLGVNEILANIKGLGFNTIRAEETQADVNELNKIIDNHFISQSNTQKVELLSLLRETAMRNQIAFPQNEQDEKWFNETVAVYNSGDFINRLFKTLELGIEEKEIENFKSKLSE